MHLFYSTQVKDGIIQLDENDSRHAVKVLRLREGDTIHVVDGLGNRFKAEISTAHHKHTNCAIVESVKETELPYLLHMAVAPTKNIDRFEWFLEKATELGITEITPLLCEHSERKVIKPERLERIVVSAMKQSLKATKPKINSMVKITEFVNQQFEGHKFMAHCEKDKKVVIPNLQKGISQFTILIGPEGDFSPKEIELAKNADFEALSLGNSRLRTETAAVTAVTQVYSLFI